MIPSCHRPPPIRTVIAVSDIEPDYLNIRNPCGRTERRFLAPNSQTRSWPSSCIGSGADYGVDFSALLCGDDCLTKVAFSVPGGALGWSGFPTIFGNIAVAWINWTQAGVWQVEVTALTVSGASITVLVTIAVSGTQALLFPTPPDIAPNVLSLTDGTYLELTDGGPLTVLI